MKYIIIFILLSSSVAAQNFASQIKSHRENYRSDFINQPSSPLKEVDLQYLNFFKADSNYKVIAKVALLKNQKAFQMPTFDGTSKEFIRYATLKFKLNGQELQLTLYRNISLMTNPIYKNLLFLPFTDETSNVSTYGGGRYLDLDLSTIKNQNIMVDFNKAYNPYCAYSDGYRCPIPPEENDLAIAILAGEQNYTGEKKHKN